MFFFARKTKFKSWVCFEKFICLKKKFGYIRETLPLRAFSRGEVKYTQLAECRAALMALLSFEAWRQRKSQMPEMNLNLVGQKIDQVGWKGQETKKK